MSAELDPIAKVEFYHNYLARVNNEYIDDLNLIDSFEKLKFPSKSHSVITKTQNTDFFTSFIHPFKISTTQDLEDKAIAPLMSSKEEIKNLIVKTQKQMKHIEELKKEINPLNRQKITQELLKLEYHYNITLLQIMAVKCDMLKTMLSLLSTKNEKVISLSEQSLRNDLITFYQKYRQEADIYAKEIKEIKKSLSREESSIRRHLFSFYETITGANQEIEIYETWKLSSWGRLIVGQNNDEDGLKFNEALEGFKIKKKAYQESFIKKYEETEPKNLDISVEREMTHICSQIKECDQKIAKETLLRLAKVINQTKKEIKTLRTEKGEGAIVLKVLDYERLIQTFNKVLSKYQRFDFNSLELEQIAKEKKSLQQTDHPEKEKDSKELDLLQREKDCLTELKIDTDSKERVIFELLEILKLNEESFSPLEETLTDNLLKAIQDCQTKTIKWSKELKNVRLSFLEIEKTLPDTFEIQSVVSDFVEEKPVFLKKTQFESMEESWKYSPWGQVLLSNKGPLSTTNNLSLGFQEAMNTYKKEKRKLQIQIARLKYSIELSLPASDNSKVLSMQKNLDQLEEKLLEINKGLTHTIMVQIIDVLGQKTSEYKKIKNSKSNNSQLKNLEKEINILSEAFDKNKIRYSKILIEEKNKEKAQVEKKQAPQSTFIWKLINDQKNAVLSLFFGAKFYSVQELTTKFHYAKVGYNMTEYVAKFLNSLEVQENETSIDVLKREVQNFLNWAENHPWTASQLASDIALTCSILISDEKEKTHLIHALTAKASSVAFLTALRDRNDEEPIESEEQLKFRALADLCRYTPLVAGAVVGLGNFINKDSWSTMGLVKSVGIEVLKAAGLQAATRVIPRGYENIAMSAAQILRGDDFQKILDQRAVLASISMAGALKEIVKNPDAVVQQIQKSVTLWWKTMFEAKSWKTKLLRISVQLVLPVVSVVVAGGVVAAGVVGAVFTFGASIPIALGTLATGWSATRALYTFVNVVDSQTRADCIQDLEEKEFNKYREIFSQKPPKELIALKKEYLKTVPQMAPVRIKKLDQMIKINGKDLAENDWYEKVVKEERNHLLASLNARISATPNELRFPGFYTKSFVECVQIDSIRHQIISKTNSSSENEQELISERKSKFIDFMTYEIYTDLQKTWLEPQLENSIIEATKDMALRIAKGSKKEVMEEVNKDIKENANVQMRLAISLPIEDSPTLSYLKGELESDKFNPKDIEEALKSISL